MAIMRIGAPSGFEAQKAGLEGNSLIKRLETAGGQLIIYFDDVRLIIMLIPVQKCPINILMQHIFSIDNAMIYRL